MILNVLGNHQGSPADVKSIWDKGKKNNKIVGYTNPAYGVYGYATNRLTCVNCYALGNIHCIDEKFTYSFCCNNRKGSQQDATD